MLQLISPKYFLLETEIFALKFVPVSRGESVCAVCYQRLITPLLKTAICGLNKVLFYTMMESTKLNTGHC